MRAAELHVGQKPEVERTLKSLLQQGALRKQGKRYLVSTATKEGEPLTRRRAGPWAQPVGERRERQARPGERSHGPRDGQRSGASSSRQGGYQGRRNRGELKTGVFVEGSLRMHRDGYGFVHPLEGENIFIPAFDAQRALDGDRVRVEVRQNDGDRFEGRIVELLSRRREQAVGLYILRGKHAWVEPNDGKLSDRIRVPPTQLARPGDLVTVRLHSGAGLMDEGEGLSGEVTGSLGRPGHPSSEVLSIVFSQGFSDAFPDSVMEEAALCPEKVDGRTARSGGRKDLRDLPLLTIDGADARDFDDALYAEPHPRGHRLVVAIADVTHYVRENSAMDAEALHRATSVYLPDHVLPMLPEKLSTGICSLRPDVDRLCMVADLVIDRTGKRVSSELYPAVMRSVARCTYEEVQSVLDGEDVPKRTELRGRFEELSSVAKRLNGMRKQRGALDFDLEERRVVLDDEGYPARVELRERLWAHRIIEECMLAANEAVASTFHELGLPTIYRFHDEPDAQKLAAFVALAEAQGFTVNGPDDRPPSSQELSALLTAIDGHPEQRVLNQLLLRAMMQAVYSSEHIGHYGLAATHYLHFTSPIRRYPDLIVHRLLKAHWRRKGKARSQKLMDAEEAQLEAVAAQSSERERAAMQAEREVTQTYVVHLMKDRVGEEFNAAVASLTDFGFFIELVDEHVEGLVASDTLGPGVRFDAVRHVMTWPSGRKVRVGTPLTARLVAVDAVRRQLNLEVVAFHEDASARTDEEGGGARPQVARKGAAKPQARQRADDSRDRDRRGLAVGKEDGGRRTPRRKGRPAIAPERSRAGVERQDRATRAAAASLRSPTPSSPSSEPAKPLKRPPPSHESFETRAPFVPPGMEEQGQASRADSVHPGFDRLRALASQGRKTGARTRDEERAPSKGGKGGGKGRGGGGRKR